MRSILNFFLTLLFTRIIFKNQKTKTGEKILYEIKDAINNFYLNEILKEQKNFTDDRIIKLYTANYQYTYKSLINSKYFNNQIISSFCNNLYFYFPLNKDILKIIQSKGIKVNFYSSSLMNIFLSIFLITKNCFLIFYYLILSFKIKAYYKKNKIIYLSYIPKLNENHKNNNDINFFEWVKNYFGIKQTVTYTHTNKKIKNYFSNKGNYLIKKININTNFFSLFLIFDLIKSIILALKLMLSSLKNKKLSNLNCFIFDDLILYHFFKFNKRLKPDICFFSNIELMYRPYWTYALSKNTYLYYMSTNTNFIKKKNSKIKFYDLFLTKFYTWDNYICWTNEQRKWLKDNVKFTNPKVMMCKFIPFHGQNTTLSKFKNEKIISIFDVPPKNNKFKLTFLNPYNLYTEKYCIKFLEDIIKNIKGSNIKIIIKIKNINEDMSKKYFKYIDILEKKNKNNILIYRAGISAKSVIKVSDIVISLPFSSPSLIAKRMKIESFYYDPLNIVKLTEYNDRSVNMINTKKNLKKIIEDSKLLN